MPVLSSGGRSVLVRWRRWDPPADLRLSDVLAALSGETSSSIGAIGSAFGKLGVGDATAWFVLWDAHRGALVTALHEACGASILCIQDQRQTPRRSIRQGQDLRSVCEQCPQAGTRQLNRSIRLVRDRRLIEGSSVDNLAAVVTRRR